MNVHMSTRLLSLVLLVSALASAGPAVGPPANSALGPLYAISEPDLLTVIEATVRRRQADGTLADELNAAQVRARAYVAEPPPVLGLRRARTTTSSLFDPSVRLDRDVVDAAGTIRYPAGTQVNPLAHVQLAGRLVFFDARDPGQVNLAIALLSEDVHTRAILVGGSPAQFWERSGAQPYFDQGGMLVSRLGIVAVPAIVTQEGQALRIATVAVGTKQ